MRKGATSKRRRTESAITTTVHSATVTCLSLLPPHAATFSTLAGLGLNDGGSHASRSRTISMLNNTIDLVTTVRELVELDIVKGVLYAVGALLIVLRDTAVNKNNHIELAFYCARICFILNSGTFGKREEDINPSVLGAVFDLRSTVNAIKDSITCNVHRRYSVRIFHSRIDKDQIQGWRQALDGILHVLHTDIHATAGLKDMTSDPLCVMQGDEFKEPYMVSTPHTTSPGEHPPISLELFFGRDDLVWRVVDCVKKRMHTALIGPGGIGKTSVARNVLNHQSIKDGFPDKRYFVKCDDFVVSHDRFLDRVAQVIGVKLLQSSPLSSFRAFLASLAKPLLLILDGAEVLQESPIDNAEMADLIDEIGSCPAISLLLTTRNATLPGNTIFHRVDVPPLEADAAMDAFFAVYRHEQPSSVIRGVLDNVDHHPLSVNLLAWAGTQNLWSVSKLIEQWKSRGTGLLANGDHLGKAQSLAVSIELSLHSPTMKRLGDNALYILQVIAFLPQGVHQRHLQELFSSVPNVHSIVDTLRRLSLAHENADFITMLAPIRLYLQEVGLLLSPLLRYVRDFYYKQLATSEDGEGTERGSWVVSEDDNIERLIAYYFSSEDLLETCQACSSFLTHLYHRKPRRTSLTRIICELPEQDALGFWKADCLETMGWIAYTTGRYTESTELALTARKIFLAHGNQSRAVRCLMDLADVDLIQGRLVDAETQGAEALEECRNLQDHAGEARCNEMLGEISRLRGNISEASRFLSTARKYYESTEEMWNVGFIRTELGDLEFVRGNYSEGREYFESAIAIFIAMGDNHHVGWSFQQFARAEWTLSNWSQVHELLDKARTHYLEIGATLQAARCLRERGHAYCYRKELSEARECLVQAQHTFSLTDSTLDQAMCNCDLAWIEFHHQDFRNAKDLLAQARGSFADIGDLYWEALCTRNLGEIAFLEKDYHDAQMLFTEADRKSRLSEAKTGEGYFYLGVGLKGWRSFQQGHLGAAQIP